MVVLRCPEPSVLTSRLLAIFSTRTSTNMSCFSTVIKPLMDEVKKHRSSLFLQKIWVLVDMYHPPYQTQLSKLCRAVAAQNRIEPNSLSQMSGLWDICKILCCPIHKKLEFITLGEYSKRFHLPALTSQSCFSRSHTDQGRCFNLCGSICRWTQQNNRNTWKQCVVYIFLISIHQNKA